MTVFHRLSKNSDKDADVIDAEISQEFLNRIPGGIFRYYADGEERLDYYSHELILMYGCETNEEFEELTGGTFRGMVHPDDIEKIEREIKEQVAIDNHDRVRYRIIRRDGEIRWVEDLGILVTDSAGIRWFYVNIIDITAEINYRHALEKSYERLGIITAFSNDVVFDMDCSTDTIEVFGNFQERFGRDPETSDFIFMRRHEDRSQIDPKYVEEKFMPPLMQDGELQDFEISLPGANGEPIWCRYQSFIQIDDKGHIVRRVGRLLDTHEMTLRKAELQRQAEHDGLTNLLNRSAARKRIEEALDGSRIPVSFIILDIDDFKSVNDGYGHPEGDRVIQELADHLRRVCRGDDVVARLGGDEFVVFAKGVGSGSALENLAQRLLSVKFSPLRRVLPDGSYEVSLPTISVGVATCETSAIDCETLYSAADTVLYESKSEGKNQVNFCTVESSETEESGL